MHGKCVSAYGNVVIWAFTSLWKWAAVTGTNCLFLLGFSLWFVSNTNTKLRNRITHTHHMSLISKWNTNTLGLSLNSLTRHTFTGIFQDLLWPLESHLNLSCLKMQRRNIINQTNYVTTSCQIFILMQCLLTVEDSDVCAMSVSPHFSVVSQKRWKLTKYCFPIFAARWFWCDSLACCTIYGDWITIKSWIPVS